MKKFFFLFVVGLCASVTKGWAQDSFTLTIGNSGYATLYYDKALSFEDVDGQLKAFTATYVQNGVVALSRAYVVPAKTGVVVKGNSGTYTLPVTTSQSYYANMLRGVLTDTELNATQTVDGVEYTNFVLANGNNGVGFYQVSPEGGNLAAYKAYLRMKSSAVTANAMNMAFDESDTDLIEGLDADAPAEDAWFTLQGVPVAYPSVKGVYIHKGRKVIVK